MEHERGFLQAIQESPDDDLHRLAWADWLDDQGDASRAAFIRAQLQAARLAPGDLQRDALEDEVDELLAEHEQDWAGRLGQLALEWRWKRGCIEHITVWADTLLTHGQELFATMPIRELRILADADELPRLADWPLLERVESLELTRIREESLFTTPYLRDTPILALLSSRYLTRLTALDLRGQGVEGPALQAILDRGLLGQLRRLELANAKAVGDRFIRQLANTNSSLQTLSLANTNLTPYGLRALLQSRKHPHLRQLDVNFGMLFRGEVTASTLQSELLSVPLAQQLETLHFERVSLTVEAVENLLESPLAQQLTALELNGCWYGGEIAATLAASPNLANLRRLIIPSNVLRDKGIVALARSPHLSNLLELDVSQNGIASPGLRALMTSTHLQRLERLNLAMNYIGVPGCELLAQGDQPRRLTALNLASTNLDPRAIEGLLHTPALSRLRVLWLNGNLLGDEGLATLAACSHLTRLRQLHLDSNEVDSPGAQALLESPNLKRVKQLSMRNAYITSNEREQLRARFGAATQF